ncbi:MAG TPA: hypothetical protein PK395_05980 [bacterium]|nr:hypothetical protein [bacterium]
MNESSDPDEKFVLSAFAQLMQEIRDQTNQVHSWTKLYLSIQAALAVALSFLIKLGSNGGFIVNAGNAGSIVIPILGIATSWCLTDIILHEMSWQGEFIRQIRKLPKLPAIYPVDPDPRGRSYIGKRFCVLRIFLIAGWAIWLSVSVYQIIWGGTA